MRRVWPWRRACQALVLGSLLLSPLVARYGHYLWARQVEKTLDQWGPSLAGAALRAIDGLLRAGLPLEESGVKGRRPRKAMLARAALLVGSPAWSARLFGLSLTDLLAGLESGLATRGRSPLASSRGVQRGPRGTARDARIVLLTGLLVPLAGTLLLGRVYCGWICPMGLLLPLARRLRDACAFLELPPGEHRLWRGDKYLLLGAGAVLVALTGLPLLHYLYPPAILARESHAFAAALFDRAEAGRFGFPWGAFSAGLLFLGAIAAVEVALAPGFWCASLCPGGALYAALSRWKRLGVRREKPACVDCLLCDRACPLQLRPMLDQTGAECDACGVCVDACPTRALSLGYTRPAPRVSAPRAAALAAALLLAAPAAAHHIIGIPHYAYDESFPQAPVLKLRERLGPYEAVLTAYPGNPKPGERSEIHVYIVDPAANAPYEKAVLLEAYRLRAFGAREPVDEPREGLRDLALYKFHLVYPAEANYELVLRLPELDGGSTLRFPLVVGEPGSPWAPLAAFVGALAALLIGVRAFRIKRARRARIAAVAA